MEHAVSIRVLQRSPKLTFPEHFHTDPHHSVNHLPCQVVKVQTNSVYLYTA